MVINGRNAVLEALKSGGEGVEKVYIMYGVEGEPVVRIRSEAQRCNVPCVTLDRGKFIDLERRAGMATRSQGILATVAEVKYIDIEERLQDIYTEGRVPLLAAIDGITDPHNVGAIIRSAECAGLDALMMGTHHSSGVNDVVMKTSAGAARYIPIARPSNIGDVLIGLKQEAVAVVVLDERGTISYTDFDFTVPSIIVVGSEGEGVSPRVRKLADAVVMIPVAGNIESLNASVAAGIVFFEAARQRRIASIAASTTDPE
jgi:23S rRNA (guanosine2251-2'-O)-methyltransferase